MPGYLLILIACMLWSIDPLVRYPLLGTGISATTVVFFEHLYLVIIFAPAFWMAKRKLLKLKFSDLISFVIIGGLGSGLGTLAFTKAFSILNPSLVILLQKFQPILAIVLANLVLKESLGKEFILWAIVSFVGGLLIVLPDVRPLVISYQENGLASLLSQDLVIGYLLTFVPVFAWGASTVFGKRLHGEKFSASEIMAGRYYMAIIFLLPFFVNGSVQTDLSLKAWGSILFMAVNTGLISMYIYYQGLKRISAKLCTLLEMFFPLFSVMVNWIVLEKTLLPIQIIGGLILLLGSTIIQLRKH